jgi:hypothetical protein
MAEREFRTEDGRTKFKLDVAGSVYGGRPINYKGEFYEVLWPPLTTKEPSPRDSAPMAYRVRRFDSAE